MQLGIWCILIALTAINLVFRLAPGPYPGRIGCIRQVHLDVRGRSKEMAETAFLNLCFADAHYLKMLIMDKKKVIMVKSIEKYCNKHS